MQTGVITDNQMSASSEWDPNHAASHGRIFFELTTKADTWSGRRNDANQWLQIDLTVYFRVTRIVSQGRSDHSLCQHTSWSRVKMETHSSTLRQSSTHSTLAFEFFLISLLVLRFCTSLHRVETPAIALLA